ncbi:hydantoinase/oxoprolinase family protein [Chelativorans sp. M5D2P16]|uniref:hydantoinase/oxoprolinase family protein n=1 Tax=Chelativorans sp. M5D2P16 TaxID=3095678 RepID=UPI002ACA43E8|nr:hydantoinase/oxoprolinase family protein [Chelativorans sp. M5D2P16]MDZ5696179.1 hydantoinase/oxoprolinase family protein [Chelativorans sp. M5D2P16]
MTGQKKIVAGFDIGGAHLKVARVEDGRVTAAATVAAPLRLGLDTLAAAFRETTPIHAGAELGAFTMTGELSEAFPSRTAGVAALLDEIARHFSADSLIYTTRSGLVAIDQARTVPGEVASANWHATASLVARLAGDALFVDMGSTTTDIIAVRDGKVMNEGDSDAGRLATGELVYTGFVRSFPFALCSNAPVRGRFTPLMNEYFATMADVHRVLGVLREMDDQHRTADNKEKTLPASITRLARLVGRDADDLGTDEWRHIAAWFSEHQLRLIHDTAYLVSGKLADDAPVVGAGIGRWQVERLARRLERPFLDLAALIPAEENARIAASDAAPAAAVALLASC